MTKAKKPTMEEQLISFEIAKLAKEKGFDTIQTNCYDPKGTKEYIYNWRIENKVSTDQRMKRLIPAPTQSLLQKWLREEHDTHILPIRIETNVGIKYSYTMNFKVDFDEEYDTYEEALEEGLLAGLKLI